MKAILLAGGKGTRLRPLTIHTPKPIVPIFNRPFLHYQIDLLKQVPEIDEVILSLNYQPRRIEEIFGDGSDVGIKIRYVVEPAPLGTGGAIKYAGDKLTESVVVFNGDVLTEIDLGGRHPPAPRAPGPRHDRADAGREPDGLRPGRDRRRTATSGGFSRSRSRTRSRPTTSTPASTCSSPTRSTAFRATSPWSIERSYFPSLDRARRDVRRLRLRRLLDRHRHAGEVHAGASRHHGRPLRGGAVRATCRRRAPSIAADARVEDGATIEGPCFIDEGVLIKAGARVGPYSVIGRQTQIEEDASIDGAIIWPNCRVSRDAVVRNAILGRHCHVGRSVIGRTAARCSATRRR